MTDPKHLEKTDVTATWKIQPSAEAKQQDLGCGYDKDNNPLPRKVTMVFRCDIDAGTSHTSVNAQSVKGEQDCSRDPDYNPIYPCCHYYLYFNTSVTCYELQQVLYSRALFDN